MSPEGSFLPQLPSEADVAAVIKRLKAARWPWFKLLKSEGLEAKDHVRFLPLAVACERAREHYRLTVEAAAKRANVPSHEVQAIELGMLHAFSPQSLTRYVVDLRLQDAFNRWSQHFSQLARTIVDGNYFEPRKEVNMAVLEQCLKAAEGFDPKPPEASKAARPAMLKFKVTLVHSDPPIWRSILVPRSMPLSELHLVLQMAMGWADEHLYAFTFRGVRYMDEDAAPDRWTNTTLVTLDHLRLRRGSRLRYQYDFGDSWECELVLEEVVPQEVETVPICLDGRNAGPAEDSGGLYGYYDLLEASKKPGHPNHQFAVEWLGDWDPAAFDIAAVNKSLERTFAIKEPRRKRRGKKSN